MWGSTTPNTADECNWTNAPFNKGTSDYDETYFNSVKDTVCPNGILAKEYDAAAQIMGGDWRMPTEAEWRELCNNTNYEWIEDYKGTGVNGYKFTSKTNGNSIFFPAAGDCYNGSVHGVGYSGKVWSSSLVTSNPVRAVDLFFNSRYCYVSDDPRYYGQSVRGVRK